MAIENAPLRLASLAASLARAAATFLVETYSEKV
jgi:hypothetical protein